MSSMRSRAGGRWPLALAAVLVAACGGGSSDAPKPAGGLIHTEWNVQSMRTGETVTIAVSAVDSAGGPSTFSASAQGGCATVTASGDAIHVTAGGSICDQAIVLRSSTDVTKELTIHVIDPMVMDIGDGLLIRYVHDYSFQWNDAGSGGTYDAAFWHPVAGGDGWYPLGSLVRNTYATPTPTVPILVAKDSRAAGTLAAPTDYTWVYDDSGSGATLFGSVWKPVCPAGFKALGVVTNGASNGAGWNKPSLDAVRCVKASFTTPGKIGGRLYYDVGTAASAFLSVWEIGYPDYTSSLDGRVALYAGTSLGCPGWEKTSCDLGIANLLLVPMPVMQNADATELEPRLTGYRELDVSKARYFSSVRVPFTLLKVVNTAGQAEWNVHTSPFYTLQREEVYTPIDIIDHRQGTTDAVYTYKITTGISETEAKTFSQEVGLEISAGGEAKFLGAGGSWEVKLSTKLGWEQSTSSTYATTTERDYEFRIPAGKYAEIIQVTTQFRAVSWPGFTFGAPLAGNSNIIKYLQYP